MVREIVMLMRMVKWCGITGLQLVAAILCIICLGALPRLFKGLQIDLIGFGTRLYFLEESYFNGEITYGFRLKKIISANMDSLFRDNVCVYFGILLSLLIAYLLVVWVLQRSQSKQRMWNGIFVALESIPDILIILLSQLLVVIIVSPNYKK